MATINIDQSIKDIVNQYAELLKKEMKVSEIYLYGSYAKGTFTKDSDIDIAVISEDFTGDPVDDTLKLMRVRRKVDYRIEPHPFRTQDFNRNNPYVKEILEQAIKIA